MSVCAVCQVQIQVTLEPELKNGFEYVQLLSVVLEFSRCPTLRVPLQIRLDNGCPVYTIMQHQTWTWTRDIYHKSDAQMQVWMMIFHDIRIMLPKYVNLLFPYLVCRNYIRKIWVVTSWWNSLECSFKKSNEYKIISFKQNLASISFSMRKMYATRVKKYVFFLRTNAFFADFFFLFFFFIVHHYHVGLQLFTLMLFPHFFSVPALFLRLCRACLHVRLPQS